ASQTQEDPPPPSSTSGDPQLPLPEETEDESEDTWNATDVLPDESGPDETEPDGEVAEPPASSPSGSDPNNDAANTHADETPNPIDPTASDPEPEPAGTDEPRPDEPRPDEPRPDEPRPDEPRPDESTPSESGPTLSSNEGDAEGDGDAAGDIPGDDDTSNCPDVPSVSVLPGTTYEGQLFVPIISTGGSCLTGYQIDWGDGSPVEHFDIHALSPPSHVYEDDGPPNGNGTPQDDVTLQVTLQSEGGHSASASANVAVRNVAPTAVHDQYTLFEHSREIAISLLDNDFDATHSDRLRVASVNTSTLRGRLRELDNGWFSYEMYPEAACLSEGATARDHFTYTLMDDDNGKSTGSVTIVILGQREVYSLSMQVDGTMAEENQQGATLSVSISPPAACEVTVRYTQQLGSGDTANKADFVSGAEQTLRFQPGESMKVVPLVPVDDTEVEVNEIYTLHAEERIDPDSFRNYIFDPTTSNFLTQVKILDNEWRFVGDPLEVDWKLASKDIWNNLQLQPSGLFGEYFVKTATTGDWGPDTVRTHLLGVFVESFPPHTLPIVRRHRAELNETFTFHCDPASGYIQPQQGPITSGGGTGQPPLNILLNGQFSIDNSGDEYHYVTVLINADVAAYGTLTIGGSGQGIGFSTSFPWGDRLGPWKAVAMLRAKKGPMDD
ncbi:MAG: Ig-like domain-containing protein, partial [Pirellulaceae bacterium]